jgi:hypothetical protein
MAEAIRNGHDDGEPVDLLALPTLVAARAEGVLAATVRMHPAMRELLYLKRVRPLLDRLSMAEREALDAEYACAYGIGWNIASQTLGVLSGWDTSIRIGGRQPNMIYTPRSNYGGWVRIWRSKAAALPTSTALVDRMVHGELALASLGEVMEERVRGRWGITPNIPLDEESVRRQVLQSDLFRAPWMVAVWRPEHNWVVAGAASRYLSGELASDDPALFDLLGRVYADQTFPPRVDEGAGTPSIDLGRQWLVPAAGAGPEVGLDRAIQWVEHGLRRGYRVDFVWEPAERPLDVWEDGLPGVAEAPLMGFLIHTPTMSFLPAIRYEEGEARLEGICEADYDLFRTMTGVEPDKRLTNRDLETLNRVGVAVYGRIPSFAMKVEHQDR